MRFVSWALIVSMVLAVGSCAPPEDTPRQALEAFIGRWEAGDYVGMYGFLSASARAACTEEVFVTRHKKISAGIGLSGLKLDGVSWGEGRLQYRLSFTTTTVGEFTQEYSLEACKEEGIWRFNWDHCHIFPGLTGNRVVRVSREMPKRGDILDARGLILATTGSVYEVGLVKGRLAEDTGALLGLLLDLPLERIEGLLEQDWVKEDSFVPVATLDSETWARLRPALSPLPGVLVQARTERLYSVCPSLAQTVGYVGKAKEGQLGDLALLGFEPGDTSGCCGLELMADEALAGRPGFVIDIRDGQGNTLSVVARRPVEPGRDVAVTLDLGKSQILAEALGGWPGSALLLNFQTGDILAVASNPGFDPNLLARGISSGEYEELLALDSPFLNRAFNGLYPPGSVFKPFTALMALEEEVFDPIESWDTPVLWQGGPDWGGYSVTRVLRPLGPVDLWEAMRWSDNVYFADLGLKVGWAAFAAYCRQLGFDQDLPFALSYEQSRLGGQEGTILLADSSYGQGKMLVTPLHIALMYAAIARKDGILPRPRLLATAEVEGWLQGGFAQENLELVDGVLAYAASDSAASAWVASSVIRGKTGTSETSKTRQTAWYICYFDETLLAITLEGDYSLSSTQAVQVARQCLESLRAKP